MSEMTEADLIAWYHDQIERENLRLTRLTLISSLWLQRHDPFIRGVLRQAAADARRLK